MTPRARKFVRIIRERIGLTQGGLASAMGFPNRERVAALEGDLEREPRGDVIQAFIDFCGWRREADWELAAKNDDVPDLQPIRAALVKKGFVIREGVWVAPANGQPVDDSLGAELLDQVAAAGGADREDDDELPDEEDELLAIARQAVTAGNSALAGAALDKINAIKALAKHARVAAKAGQVKGTKLKKKE